MFLREGESLIGLDFSSSLPHIKSVPKGPMAFVSLTAIDSKEGFNAL